MAFRPSPYLVPALDRKTGLPSLADLDRERGVLVVLGALALISSGDLPDASLLAGVDVDGWRVRAEIVPVGGRSRAVTVSLWSGDDDLGWEELATRTVRGALTRDLARLVAKAEECWKAAARPA
jgi:hypothetical protein